MKLIKLAAILLAPLFLSSVLSAATQIASAENNVVVVVKGVATPAKAGDTIPAGATIKVSEGKSAQVTLPDGTKVTLNAGAELVVSSSTSQDGISKTTVKLNSGTAVFSVNLPKGSSLTINTSAGSITGNKGVVSVTATSNLATLTSADGRWRIQNDNGAVATLGKNQSAMIKQSDRKISPRPATRGELQRTNQASDSATPVFSTESGGEMDPFAPAEIEGANLNAVGGSEEPDIPVVPEDSASL